MPHIGAPLNPQEEDDAGDLQPPDSVDREIDEMNQKELRQKLKRLLELDDDT